jgi:hypothetical protein
MFIMKLITLSQSFFTKDFWGSAEKAFDLALASTRMQDSGRPEVSQVYFDEWIDLRDVTRLAD